MPEHSRYIDILSGCAGEHYQDVRKVWWCFCTGNTQAAESKSWTETTAFSRGVWTQTSTQSFLQLCTSFIRSMSSWLLAKSRVPEHRLNYSKWRFVPTSSMFEMTTLSLAPSVDRTLFVLSVYRVWNYFHLFMIIYEDTVQNKFPHMDNKLY